MPTTPARPRITAERIDTPEPLSAGDRVRCRAYRQHGSPVATHDADESLATFRRYGSHDNTLVVIRQDVDGDEWCHQTDDVTLDWDATLVAVAPGWQWARETSSKLKPWSAADPSRELPTLSFQYANGNLYGLDAPDEVSALVRRRNAAEGAVAGPAESTNTCTVDSGRAERPSDEVTGDGSGEALPEIDDTPWGKMRYRIDGVLVSKEKFAEVAGGLADTRNMRAALAREELQDAGTDCSRWTRGDLVAHYDSVIAPREAERFEQSQRECRGRHFDYERTMDLVGPPADAGLPGMLNHPDVPSTTREWTSATIPAEHPPVFRGYHCGEEYELRTAEEVRDWFAARDVRCDIVSETEVRITPSERPAAGRVVDHALIGTIARGS